MFVSDAQLLSAVANTLKMVGGSADLPAYYASDIVPRANQVAYLTIVESFLRRGHRKADIDLYDMGALFQTRLGVFWSLQYSGAYAGFDPATLKGLDAREELKEALLFVGGVWVKPLASNPKQVTTGPIRDMPAAVFGQDDDGEIHW